MSANIVDTALDAPEPICCIRWHEILSWPKLVQISKKGRKEWSKSSGFARLKPGLLVVKMIYIMQHSRSHIIQPGSGREGKKSMVHFPPLLSRPLRSRQLKVAVDCLFINCSFLPILSCFLLAPHKLEMVIPQQKPWTGMQAVITCLGCRRMKTNSNERQQTGHGYPNYLGPWKYLKRIQLPPEDCA